jgi:uncharacterized protein involved in high-affinity Fe2+ transport
MKKFTIVLLGFGLTAGVPAFSGAGEAPAPSVMVLETPADATQKTILVGRVLVDEMIIQLELEPAKGMWMQMGNSSMWMEHAVDTGEFYHVEVKPIDPQSNTRISYVDVRFEAVNADNGERISGDLHPMWGGSGLHYAFNSGLAGDGVYEATVTVGVPSFARDLKGKDMWSKPVTARFHFKLTGGKLVEVSEPTVD